MIETSKKHDDDPQPEVSSIGDSTHSFESLNEVTDYLQEKSTAFLEEAQRLGFTGIILFSGYDMLDKETQRTFARRGNYYTVLGMLQDAQSEMQQGNS